jgi:electron transfer flavoprotein alpha subunit
MAIDRVWVLAEASDGKVATITLELLTKARQVAGRVEAFLGADGDAHAETLGRFGATTVYATGEPGNRLSGPPVASAMAAQIAAGNAPDAILFGTTYAGRDVAARLSVKLDRPVITNTTDLEVDGDTIVGVEPIFGGTQVVRTRFTADPPYLVTVLPKSFAAEESGNGPADVVAVEVPDLGATGAAEVVGRHVEEQVGPKLDEAAVVVAGGRGLGGAEKYELVEELARLLNGAPGASRAIVDAG